MSGPKFNKPPEEGYQVSKDFADGLEAAGTTKQFSDEVKKQAVPNAETQAAMKEARRAAALKKLRELGPIPPYLPITKDGFEQWIRELLPLDPDVITKGPELTKDVVIDLDEPLEDDE